MTAVVFGNDATDGFAEALVYGADMGARVSSNSWGYTVSGVYGSDVLEAIDYADSAGVLVVFAAGNEYQIGDDVNYEGYLNSRFTISVGALGRDLDPLVLDGPPALLVADAHAACGEALELSLIHI